MFLIISSKWPTLLSSKLVRSSIKQLKDNVKESSEVNWMSNVRPHRLCIASLEDKNVTKSGVRRGVNYSWGAVLRKPDPSLVQSRLI